MKHPLFGSERIPQWYLQFEQRVQAKNAESPVVTYSDSDERKEMTSCPCCGAEELLGVWLPRVKARITKDAMHSRRTFGLKRNALKAHVWQINNLYLAETDYCLRSIRGSGCYELVASRSNEQ